MLLQRHTFAVWLITLPLLILSGCSKPAATSPPVATNSAASQDVTSSAKGEDAAANDPATEQDADPQTEESNPMQTELATFGGGCFWCTEAVFQRIDGVEKVVSGYCNGDVPNPTYEQVCTGTTGHAEVIQITFNPEKVPFLKLLEVFFKTHDPTTLNKQGYDEGTQYRSGVYFHNDQQKADAEAVKKKLDESGVFGSPIVTEIVPIEEFYAAEGYHQNYFNLNANKNRYCQGVIVPKLEKFEKAFADLLKD